MKRFFKKIIPEQIFLWYHGIWAILGTIRYGFASRKLIVIGVTGTKGKTSTANFIWAVLSAGGEKAGMISTANIRIGEKEILNPYHMTMPGRFLIQKFLRQMLDAGCRFAVVETTSEGLKQYRHLGIYYDIAVFTNLSPEHLPSHGGSFDRYRKEKGKLFQSISKARKTISGKKIPKIIIANSENEFASYFLSFPADQKITFGLKSPADVWAEAVQETVSGVSFQVGEAPFHLNILGKFNVLNALPAIIIGRIFGISDEEINRGFDNLRIIPGRMEEINLGQNFRVLVDYAHEKQSITYCLETARAMRGSGGRVIILLGAEGGGRDKTKRPVMGELAAKMADYVVVSNVDPYEDNPAEIAEDIARASEKLGKIRNKDLFVILDRREGIRKALSLGVVGDTVLITGKGAEQSIVIGGKSFPWDDREVVREELGRLRGGQTK